MINACVVGLGHRGMNLLTKILLPNKKFNIIAVSDAYEDRVKEGVDQVRAAGGEAKGFTDFKEALNVKGLDAVFIFTGWEGHTEVALYAMEKGIAIGSEVGCEYTLENCFELVRMQEKTGTPYMFMENCCWGKNELMATSMARHGLFGTIVHCSGAYAHDLRNEVSYGLKNRHYRFRNYQNRCCDNYPTHELGPISKLLDINRGNRILTVSSFASKAAGLEEYIKTLDDASEEMKNARFKQGDIINTVLTCANGETILMRLDTTLPIAYNREFTVRGTKGMYTQTTNTAFFNDTAEHIVLHDFLKENLFNGESYEQDYLPDFWKNLTPEAKEAGHGGIDWFCYNAFADALEAKAPMPVDIYDAATWQAVSVLSEMSINLGGMPQALPDFTFGQWFKRPRLDVCEL